MITVTNKYEFLRDEVNHKFEAGLGDLNSDKALIVKTKMYPTRMQLQKELEYFGEMPPLTTHIKLAQMHTDDLINKYESIQAKYESYVDELNKLVTALIGEIRKRTTQGRQPSTPREEVTAEDDAELEVEGTEIPDEVMSTPLPPTEQPLNPGLNLLANKVEEKEKIRKLRRQLTREEREALILTAYHSLPVEKRTADQVMKRSGMSRSHVYVAIKRNGLKFMGIFRTKGMKLSGFPKNDKKNEPEVQKTAAQPSDIPSAVQPSQTDPIDNHS